MGKLKPQVIEDDEHQGVFERVAAIDVAKASGMVCVRLPGRDGRRRASKVWEVQAVTSAVSDLGRHLLSDRVQMVTLEAASGYWRIWVRHEAHCCIARSAGGNRRRCFSDLMAYQGPKG